MCVFVCMWCDVRKWLRLLHTNGTWISGFFILWRTSCEKGQWKMYLLCFAASIFFLPMKKWWQRPFSLQDYLLIYFFPFNLSLRKNKEAIFSILTGILYTLNSGNGRICQTVSDHMPVDVLYRNGCPWQPRDIWKYILQFGAYEMVRLYIFSNKRILNFIRKVYDSEFIKIRQNDYIRVDTKWIWWFSNWKLRRQCCCCCLSARRKCGESRHFGCCAFSSIASFFLLSFFYFVRHSLSRVKQKGKEKEVHIMRTIKKKKRWT